MMSLSDLSHDELAALHEEQVAAYDALLTKGLKLDLTRGKPSSPQLDLSNELLTLPGEGNYLDSTGTDCRNYGGLQGLPAIRTIFAPLLNVPVDQLVAGDNSSLSIMHDALVYALLKGTVDSVEPWSRSPVKFICPVPGYDRHFALCEQYGIEMISVPLTQDGPDLDQVRRLLAEDPSVKGMWIVPMYSNPNGAIYTEFPHVLGQRVRGASLDRRGDPRARCAHDGGGGRPSESGLSLRLDVEDHLRWRGCLVLRKLALECRVVPEESEQADHRTRQDQPSASRVVFDGC
jgi:alanine-glyoxylate aminotransferase-like protein